MVLGSEWSEEHPAHVAAYMVVPGSSFNVNVKTLTGKVCVWGAHPLHARAGAVKAGGRAGGCPCVGNRVRLLADRA